ncbi:MAG: DUF2523 domain-containing protein [Rhodoferax sp.]|uniref:DUF2523 domain-containing protein n=1 Tax=Rhodoferax sp. TaxID=50421 RepID=UPI0026118F9C|nr:DUF2523 domain-containing protein [Rhodoferax sp.]MDD5333648.1 DUF2523 domain-containing protein [Rhodoferax sp.]MDD5333658.1 DUF2523 domain-containing protein [Rhodoferax sp.]
MPVFVAALLGGLYNIAGTLAGQVLIGLGISVVTYSGVSATMDFLMSGAVSAFGSLPANVTALFGLLKIGPCISMVFSAMAVRASLSGLTSGSMKRWVMK